MSKAVKKNVAISLELSHCIVVNDVYSAPKAGKKRAIKFHKGETLICANLGTNQYGSEYARVIRSDGSSATINPKWLKATAALEGKELAGVKADMEKREAERASGNMPVSFTATVVDTEEKRVLLKIGEDRRYFPKSQVTLKGLGNGQHLATVPAWLVRSKLGDKADALIAKGSK